LADRPLFQSPVPEIDRGASGTDTGVGATKAPITPLVFAPRFESAAVAAAVVLQLIVLIAMILGRTVPYVGAQTVLLHVEPVDPRDLLRGDYVTLGYAFNQIPMGSFKEGQAVYVTLVPEPDGRHYRAGQYLTQPPSSGVFIRGTARGNRRATYGIESYYVQEGTGHDYEQAVLRRRLWAEVALDRGGNPALRRLVIE
jgi:GDYXXLXY protein